MAARGGTPGRARRVIAWPLLFALTMPPEAPADREARVALIRESAAEAARQEGVRGLPVPVESFRRLLWVIGRTESGDWSLAVHAGQPGRGGALCLWQIDPGAFGVVRKIMAEGPLVGTDAAATSRCARTGARVLAVSLKYCWKRGWRTHWMAAASMKNGTKRSCRPAVWARKRANRAREMPGR